MRSLPVTSLPGERRGDLIAPGQTRNFTLQHSLDKSISSLTSPSPPRALRTYARTHLSTIFTPTPIHEPRLRQK
ncbi:hypothetical protein E2C01_068627 [Portunus trituberculatus]|uniref:Uncharacterized protein n=1 Tax=Portunus trituberculatus TaxID=210409 RepID=A0A5B7HPB0_PORTR|nr:hypothetical protein [Portunus trituberculatus]